MSSENQETLQTYESSIDEYIAGTEREVVGHFKTWIDATLDLLSPEARIIEIGSAFGRDAAYMESKGFTVERTDATEVFVTYLQKQGYEARFFNILTDGFTATYDLVFANAVFLHLTREQLRQTLAKIHSSLSEDGLLSFSIKYGEGEGWSTSKIGKPRYFCYWMPDQIEALLRANGFEVISLVNDGKFLDIIARNR